MPLSLHQSRQFAQKNKQNITNHFLISILLQ